MLSTVEFSENQHTQKTMKALPLSPEQKQICREHPELYPAQIINLPGMEGTTKRQVMDYLRKPADNRYKETADAIESLIASDGLPRQYATVIDYVRYLRGKA